jgi:hypothetical protein
MEAAATRIENELALVGDDPESDPSFVSDLHTLIAANKRMREALQTTAGNIRSLGPAGALDQVPMTYQRWLASVEAALVQ